MIPATIIAIEGPDKVGKQTQTKLLAFKLRCLGWKVKSVEVPIDDHFTHKLIYWMLKGSFAKKFPRFFQFIHFLNKYLWQLTVCPYLSWKYDYIIMDRWAASAIVYGRATYVNETFLKWTYNRLMKPDATIVLMGKSHKAERLDDSYESDSQLQEDVRSEYIYWARMQGPKRVTILDNSGGRISVHKRIMKAIGPEGHNKL